MKIFLIFFTLFLAACSGPELPLAKATPDQETLVRPPWEALVKAGPGADKDIDFETLNGTPSAPTDASTIPVPEGTPASPKESSTEIVAVAVVPVSGPGGAELTAAMRKILKEAGWPVLSAPRPDALTINGRVAVDVARNSQQLVHLVWVVSSPKGINLGEVKQNNPVPAGTLDQGWGENAGFAAQAAAGGIFKLIEKFR